MNEQLKEKFKNILKNFIDTRRDWAYGVEDGEAIGPATFYDSDTAINELLTLYTQSLKEEREKAVKDYNFYLKLNYTDAEEYLNKLEKERKE